MVVFLQTPSKAKTTPTQLESHRIIHTSDQDVEDVERFYTNVEEAMNRHKAHHYYFIIDVFNPNFKEKSVDCRNNSIRNFQNRYTK